MKPTFILFFGTGWCGTTSVWHTLLNNQYLHTGFKKEDRILYRHYMWDTWGFLDKNKFLQSHEVKSGIPKKSILDAAQYARDTGNHEDPWFKCLGKLKQSTQDKFISPLPSINDYVEYYRELSEVTSGYYQAVGDFSNTNGFLPNQYIYRIKKELEPYFNIKPLIIFRDPIRRLFSNLNHDFYRMYSYEEKSATELFLKDIQNSYINTYQDYTYMVERLRRIFGDTEYLIMEDFFKEGYRDEVEKLERYLNYKLPIIKECYFVPDKGIKVQKGDPRLEDQWASDKEILTPEVYNVARKKLSIIYDKFEKLHGYLPADWGQPIDYNY